MIGLREGLEAALIVGMVAAFLRQRQQTRAFRYMWLGVATAVVLCAGAGIALHVASEQLPQRDVLVAAGLLATSLHTAHEAGWFNSLQEQALNLEWLVKRGSVQSALLTGMLGIQPEPTIGEVLAWLLYAFPMTVYVLRPAKPRVKTPAASSSSSRALEAAL